MRLGSRKLLVAAAYVALSSLVALFCMGYLLVTHFYASPRDPGLTSWATSLLTLILGKWTGLTVAMLGLRRKKARPPRNGSYADSHISLSPTPPESPFREDSP